jgi:adenine deaminase
MQILVEAGLTPMQAILAATRTGAELLGLEAKLGTVEPGKLADLLLLDADPLENIANTRKIFKVVQDGRVVDTAYHADYQTELPRPGRETKHLYNLPPAIRNVTPPLTGKDSALTLRVAGRGFTPASVVKLNGETLRTRWISAGELQAELRSGHTAKVGSYSLTVETPPPGGGASPPVEFLVTFK